MSPKTEDLIRINFPSFVREPYIDYFCFDLDKVAQGHTKRLVINLPPRHLKTFLSAIYRTAWVPWHGHHRRCERKRRRFKLADKKSRNPTKKD